MFNLSSARRPKPEIDSQDLDEYLLFLWKRDRHDFEAERLRGQTALYLLILAFTAARPGAVIVSDAYRKSNESLRYKVRFIETQRDWMLRFFLFGRT